jgi:hypothetical protein
MFIIFQLDEDRLISGSYDGVIRSSYSLMFISSLIEKKYMYYGCGLFIGWLLFFSYLIFQNLYRLAGILPNKIIQPLAEHSEFPIERLGKLHYTETLMFYFLFHFSSLSNRSVSPTKCQHPDFCIILQMREVHMRALHL